MMLHSINERLGVITGGKGGCDLPPLTNDWLRDYYNLLYDDIESQRRKDARPDTETEA